MQFKALQQTRFAEIALDALFWLKKEDVEPEEVGKMADLNGPYRKTRLTARRIGRNDVDGNVCFTTAVDADNKPRFCAADEVVYVPKGG